MLRNRELTVNDLQKVVLRMAGTRGDSRRFALYNAKDAPHEIFDKWVREKFIVQEDNRPNKMIWTEENRLQVIQTLQANNMMFRKNII